MSQYEQVRKVLSWASMERIQRCRELQYHHGVVSVLQHTGKFQKTYSWPMLFKQSHSTLKSSLNTLLCWTDLTVIAATQLEMKWEWLELRMIGTKRWHSRIKGTEDMITEIDIKVKATIRACSIVETSGTELNVLFLGEKQIRCLLGSCSIWTSRKFSHQLNNAISQV